MNEQEKTLREAPPERSHSVGRWLRALGAILEDLMAATRASYLGAGRRMAVSRIKGRRRL